MPIAWNEINEKSNGGTEMMARQLDNSFTEAELAHLQIIPSRVRELDDDKIRLFWCHDLPNDPEMAFRGDQSLRRHLDGSGQLPHEF